MLCSSLFQSSVGCSRYECYGTACLGGRCAEQRAIRQIVGVAASTCRWVCGRCLLVIFYKVDEYTNRCPVQIATDYVNSSQKL